MSDYGDKLDRIKDRFQKEYCEDEIPSEEKRILKKVIDINARMIDTALNDVSEIPKLQQNVQVISDKISEVQESIRTLFERFDTYLACRKLSTSCLLEVQKLIAHEAPKEMRSQCKNKVQELLKDNKDNSRKDIQFFLELVRWVVYIGPVIWIFFVIKGG